MVYRKRKPLAIEIKASDRITAIVPMGLATWKDAPTGKIQKFDVVIAKNYLTEKEMLQLSRLVNSYLDLAEDFALREILMTMSDWEERLNAFLKLTDRDVLNDADKISAAIAQNKALSEFEKYRLKQDLIYKSDFDRLIEGEENE